MSRVGTFVVLVVLLFLAITLEEAHSYNHEWYMRCCQGCNALPAPQARAVCYAGCMATAAAMPP